MEDEKKPEEPKVIPPVGDVTPVPPAPNQPTSEELQKKIKELEDQSKEKDAKLAEAQTERATIEARRKEIEAQKLRENADVDTQARLKRITENMSVDPETASAELATLLKERDEKISREAEQRAMRAVQGQTWIEKTRNGVKVSNPDLDDELVNDVMDKANVFASTGKYKTVEEAVEAATKYVKGKLDNYATKKNAVPKLPAGAGAESGGANTPPSAPAPAKEVSPLEELEDFNAAKVKRMNLRG
jgi:hypothetical protein